MAVQEALSAILDGGSMYFDVLALRLMKTQLSFSRRPITLPGGGAWVVRAAVCGARDPDRTVAILVKLFCFWG
jgi:hypothetical protein